jgi:hypothetical protein
MMSRSNLLLLTICLVATFVRSSAAKEEVLFADDFENGLSPQWTMVGLQKDDYRIRNGALEMRVQPGQRTDAMLRVTLPFDTAESITASVELTPLEPFSELGETAGLSLLDNDRSEFHAEKTIVDGQFKYFVFSPPELVFVGKPGTEESGHRADYAAKFWPANKDSGALRIIIGGHHAYFQVGPSTTGKYATIFERALTRDSKKRGFALSAFGGPKDKEHWVRFDNFRVVRSK